MAFHSKKGFWFQRSGDGAVQVIVKTDDAENASLLREVTLTADEWAAIVAEVAPPLPPVEPEVAEEVEPPPADTDKTHKKEKGATK